MKAGLTSWDYEHSLNAISVFQGWHASCNSTFFPKQTLLHEHFSNALRGQRCMAAGVCCGIHKRNYLNSSTVGQLG